MGALSLTGSKPQQKRRFSPLMPGVTHVPYPYVYRGCTGGPKEQEAFSLGCARYIEEKLFKTILPAEEVAAIFVEPIQGEGGFVPAPANFLRELRAICDRHGILLVADEVQSGCARTGKWWAIEESGVEPDIVCIAKGIASGMPLGICMTRAEIMDWKPGSHASTFGGNPISIAAALATMKIIEREAMANAASVGEFMLERLRGWTKSHATVGEVRGRGLMIGIEIVKDKSTREPAVELRKPHRDDGIRARLGDARMRRDVAAAFASADREQGGSYGGARHSGGCADLRGERD
ncbi:MAG: aminotransferase class III-fold pyridoxal phosphate-dependent enzyme [Terracidiphilus sp.]